jgi:hypothetical protein
VKPTTCYICGGVLENVVDYWKCILSESEADDLIYKAAKYDSTLPLISLLLRLKLASIPSSQLRWMKMNEDTGKWETVENSTDAATITQNLKEFLHQEFHTHI